MGNLKDDDFYDYSPSHSKVNNNEKSSVVNVFSHVNVIPKILNFLPSDKGDQSNFSNNEFASIIDIDIDEGVTSLVESNDKEELFNNNVSTMSTHSLDNNVTNIGLNKDVVASIPPTQSTNTIYSSKKNQENQTCHALMSHMQTNDDETYDLVNKTNLVIMFQDHFIEDDVENADEDIYEKVKIYKTWPTNKINAKISDENPTTRTKLFLHNMHDEWGITIKTELEDGFTKYAFEEFKLRIDKDVINQSKNLHKIFQHLWSNTKHHPMKYLKHFWITINNSDSIDSGGITKDFFDNYRSTLCS